MFVANAEAESEQSYLHFGLLCSLLFTNGASMPVFPEAFVRYLMKVLIYCIPQSFFRFYVMLWLQAFTGL